jgi:hypothetical protein
MGQPMAAGAFWVSRNRLIWLALANPMGQPRRSNRLCSLKFLNPFFILPLAFHANPLKMDAESIAIGWQC